MASPSTSILGQWRAEQLRCTIFYAKRPEVKPADLFKSVTGFDPQAESSQFGLGVTTLEAKQDHVQITLQLAPTRADLLFAPDSGNPMSKNEVPNIGMAVERLGLFAATTKAFARAVGSSKRIAFGMVALLPTESAKHSYGALKELLAQGVSLDVENSSDFHYRINRPRMEKVGSSMLKINRLSTWAAVTYTVTTFTVPVGTQSIESLGQAARAELDINSDANADITDMSPADKDQLVDVFARYATEIIASGDLK